MFDFRRPLSPKPQVMSRDIVDRSRETLWTPPGRPASADLDFFDRRGGLSGTIRRFGGANRIGLKMHVFAAETAWAWCGHSGAFHESLAVVILREVPPHFRARAELELATRTMMNGHVVLLLPVSNVECEQTSVMCFARGRCMQFRWSFLICGPRPRVRVPASVPEEPLGSGGECCPSGRRPR